MTAREDYIVTQSKVSDSLADRRKLVKLLRGLQQEMIYLEINMANHKQTEREAGALSAYKLIWMNLNCYIKPTYDEKHDAYYDKVTDEWMSSVCGDPACCYCKDRPSKPSEVK